MCFASGLKYVCTYSHSSSVIFIARSVVDYLPFSSGRSLGDVVESRMPDNWGRIDSTDFSASSPEKRALAVRYHGSAT